MKKKKVLPPYVPELKRYLAHPDQFKKEVELLEKHGCHFRHAECNISEAAEPGKCYQNSWLAAKSASVKKPMKYYQGLAVTDTGTVVEHAWTVNENRLACENTWQQPGKFYWGVEVDLKMLEYEQKKTGVIGLLNLSEQWKRRYDCNNCLFCVMKCSKCGSQKIKFTSPQWFLNNDKGENRLIALNVRGTKDYKKPSATCQTCGHVEERKDIQKHMQKNAILFHNGSGKPIGKVIGDLDHIEFRWIDTYKEKGATEALCYYRN